jgi:hypothetical protein
MVDREQSDAEIVLADGVMLNRQEGRYLSPVRAGGRGAAA